MGSYFNLSSSSWRAILTPLILYSPETLSYLQLDGRRVSLPALDDGISGAISIPDGIPFGASHPMLAWVRAMYHVHIVSYVTNE